MNIVIEEIVLNPILQIDNVINEVNIEVSDVAIPGQKGDVGDVGETGMSVYEIAVKNGFIGTELQWLESQKLIIFENLNELP